MSFPQKIRDEIFVNSARYCCICHKPKGINIEIHHIKPKKEGGKDTLENAIALCFDCHANAGHYNPNHPKGSKLSESELLKHKEKWFEIVQKNKIDEPKDNFVELAIKDKDFKGFFEPEFIKEETRFIDRNSYKKIHELLGIDPMLMVKEMKDNNKFRNYHMPFIDNINSYDEYIDYLNGDYPKKDFLKVLDENLNTDCQPVKYSIPIPNFSWSQDKEINMSNCILNLKLINYGPAILEDYKVYLTFENIVEVNSVNKKSEFFDNFKYEYNILFFEKNKAEFYPKKNILVQNDFVLLDAICFRTKHNTKKVKINWELFARNIQKNGSLELEIKPQINIKIREKFIPSG